MDTVEMKFVVFKLSIQGPSWRFKHEQMTDNRKTMFILMLYWNFCKKK